MATFHNVSLKIFFSNIVVKLSYSTEIYRPLAGGELPNETLKTRSEFESKSGSSTKCSKSMGSKSMASSKRTPWSWGSLGFVRGSSMLYSMLSRLCEPLMAAETPLTVMMVGPTWLLERARAAAMADWVDLWLRWLAASLISLVLVEPASETVSLPWRIQSSSASWRISASKTHLSFWNNYA